MVVQLGEADILVGKVAQPFQRTFYVRRPFGYGLE